MSRKKKKVSGDSQQRNRNFTMISTTNTPPMATEPIEEPHPVHYGDTLPGSRRSSPIVVDMSPKSFESSSLEAGINPKNRSSPPWMGLISGLFMLLILIASLGALFIVVAGSVIATQTQLQISDSIHFISVCLIVLGSVFLLIAMVGITAGSKRNPILTITFVLLLLGYIVAHVVMTIRMADNIKAAREAASSTWDSLDDTQRSVVQTTMKCCGFASTTDRNADPCPDVSVGCGQSVDTFAKDFRRALFIGLWTALGIDGLLIILILIATFVRSRK